MGMINEIKKEYDNLLTRFQEGFETDVKEEIDRYCLAGFFIIWGRNDHLYSPSYKEAVKEFTGKTFTQEQIITAMFCCSDDNRELKIPDFLKAAVDKDLAEGTNYAFTIIDGLALVWVTAALVNGDYTIKEAGAVCDITDRLYNYCRSKGINQKPGNQFRQYNITDKNEESYIDLRDSHKSRVIKENTLPDRDDRQKNTIRHGTKENYHADPVIQYTLTGYTSKADEQEEVRPKIEKREEHGQTFEGLMEELNGLVGLEHVKEDVKSLMNFIRVSQMRQERGMKVPSISYHLVFTGNPGTGKTTVARLVAQLYYQMGILQEGQLVETDRSSLVAGYLGQTAIKTQKVIQQAMGGVLFIDEAYSLANDEQDSYGKEAIETILKAMEDHRNELVVIVAGYTDLMHKFIDSNPGLSSRFNKYFEFPDYDGKDLTDIFIRFCETNGYIVAEGVLQQIEECFSDMYENRTENFGNARTVRNIFEKTINIQANRIAAMENVSDQDLETLTREDILESIKRGELT